MIQCALKDSPAETAASNGGSVDIILQENPLLSGPLTVPISPGRLPAGSGVNVGSKKIKVTVGDGVNEAVTVGDGVSVIVGVGGIKIAVWLAAMAAVCAMIASSSPDASVGTGALPDGKSKGAQATAVIIDTTNNIVRAFCDIIIDAFFCYE
jgi:hypothetical protein